MQTNNLVGLFGKSHGIATAILAAQFNSSPPQVLRSIPPLGLSLIFSMITGTQSSPHFIPHNRCNERLDCAPHILANDQALHGNSSFFFPLFVFPPHRFHLAAGPV